MDNHLARNVDELFTSQNDVVFAEEFVDDVAVLELPTARAEILGVGATHRITDAGASAIYRWTAQELQFFFGSTRHVVGATARKIELPGCWMVTVKLAQLLDEAVSIIFFFNESEQIVRVLAAMPAFWAKFPAVYDAKMILANERLDAMVQLEQADVVARRKQLLRI